MAMEKITINVDINEKDFIKKINEIKDIQKETDGQTITYMFTGDKSQLDGILKGVAGLKPQKIHFDLDDSLFKSKVKNLESIAKSSGDTIGKRFANSIRSEIGDIDVATLVKERIGKNSKINATNLRTLATNLNSEISKIDIAKAISDNDINVMSQYISLYRELGVVIKTFNSGNFASKSQKLPASFTIENISAQFESAFSSVSLDKMMSDLDALMKNELISVKDFLSQIYHLYDGKFGSKLADGLLLGVDDRIDDLQRKINDFDISGLAGQINELYRNLSKLADTPQETLDNFGSNIRKYIENGGDISKLENIEGIKNLYNGIDPTGKLVFSDLKPNTTAIDQFEAANKELDYLLRERASIIERRRALDMDMADYSNQSNGGSNVASIDEETDAMDKFGGSVKQAGGAIVEKNVGLEKENELLEAEGKIASSNADASEKEYKKSPKIKPGVYKKIHRGTPDIDPDVIEEAKIPTPDTKPIEDATTSATGFVEQLEKADDVVNKTNSDLEETASIISGKLDSSKYLNPEKESSSSSISKKRSKTLKKLRNKGKGDPHKALNSDLDELENIVNRRVSILNKSEMSNGEERLSYLRESADLSRQITALENKISKNKGIDESTKDRLYSISSKNTHADKLVWDNRNKIIEDASKIPIISKISKNENSIIPDLNEQLKSGEISIQEYADKVNSLISDIETLYDKLTNAVNAYNTENANFNKSIGEEKDGHSKRRADADDRVNTIVDELKNKGFTAEDDKRISEILSSKQKAVIENDLIKTARQSLGSVGFNGDTEEEFDRVTAAVDRLIDAFKKGQVSIDEFNSKSKELVSGYSDYFDEANSPEGKDEASYYSKLTASVTKYNDALREEGKLSNENREKFTKRKERADRAISWLQENKSDFGIEDGDIKEAKILAKRDKAIQSYNDKMENYARNSIKSFENIIPDDSLKISSIYKEAETAVDSLRDSLAGVGDLTSEQVFSAKNLVEQYVNLSKSGKLVGENLNFKGAQAEAEKYASSLGKIISSDKFSNISAADGLSKMSLKIRDANDDVYKLQFTYNNAMKSMSVNTEYLKTEASSLSNFFEILRSKSQNIIAYWAATAISPSDIINAGRRGFEAVRQLDTAYTEMRKVSNDAVSSLKEFQNESFATSKAIGATALELQKSAADFMRLGYAIKDAKDLAASTNIYANVGDMDISTATEHMISSVKAWSSEYTSDIEAATSITDIYNEVGNNFAITSADIGAAMEKSAASLKAAGNTMAESVALITAGNQIQQDASVTAAAMKILGLRLRGSKVELQEMGEETDDLVTSTSKLRSTVMALSGVDIMKNANEYKSTVQIIRELGEVWNGLSDIDQASLLETIAGKNRASVVAGLIENYQTIDDVLESIEGAEGSAIRENERYLDSIEGRIGVLTSQAQEFWSTTMDSDSIKMVIDGLTSILGLVTDIVKAVGSLSVSMGLIGGVGGAKIGANLFKYNKDDDRFDGLIPELIREGRSTGVDLLPLSVKSEFDLLTELDKQQLTSAKGWEKWASALPGATEASNKFFSELDSGTRKLGETNSVLPKIGEGIVGIGKSFVALAGQIAIIAGVSFLIESLAEIVHGVINYQNTMNEQISDAGIAISDSEKAISDHKAEITELKGVMEDSTASIDDVVNARERLLEIQDSVSEKYGSEASSVDLLNGSLERQLELLDEISRAEYDKKLEEINDDGKGVKKASKRIWKWLNGYSDKTNAEVVREQIENYKSHFASSGNKELNEYIASLGKFDVNYLDGRISGFEYTGDAYEYLDVITKIAEKTKELGVDWYYENVINPEKSSISSLVSSYDDFYSQMVMYDDIMPDKNARKAYEDLLAANEDYQDAVKRGDQDAINSTIEAYKNAYAQIQNLNNESISNLVDRTFSASNEALKSLDFNQAMEGKSNINAYVEKLINEISAEAKNFSAEQLINSKAVATLADEFGISADAVINKFKDLGIVQTQAYKDLEYMFGKDNIDLLSGKAYAEVYDEYCDELQKAVKAGVDVNQTVFGNIDTNNRQVLQWTDENLKRFESEIKSWGETAETMGSYSTVFGGSDGYDDTKVAYSPILQTEDGPVLLSRDTVDKYIFSLMDKLPEEWHTEDLLALDAKGLEIDGQIIKNIIADVGETAESTSQKMHFLGRDGSLQELSRRLKEVEFDEKDLEYAYKIKNVGNMTFDELKDHIRQLKNMAENGIDFKTRIDLEAADAANSEDAKNALTDYDKYTNLISTGKDLRKKGQTGGSRFQSVAKMMSMNGMTDVADWDENIAELDRYFTEDPGKGLSAFVEKLSRTKTATEEAKGAAGEYIAEWDSASNTWNINTHDLEGIAKAMNMPIEMLSVLMNGLTEYGFSDTFFGTIDEGTSKLTDKISQLADAKAKLTTMDPSDGTEYQAQLDLIKNLEEDIETLKKGITDLANTSKDSSEDMVEAGEAARQAIIDQYNAVEGSDEAAQKERDAIKAAAVEKESTYGFKIDFGDTEAKAMRSLDEINADLKAAESKFKQLSNDDGGFKIDINGAQLALEELNALIEEKQRAQEPLFMRIDATQLKGDTADVVGDLQTVLGLVQQIQEAQAKGIDSSELQAELNTAIDDLKSSSDLDVYANLGLNDEEFQSALSGLQAPINGELTPESIDAIYAVAENITPEIIMDSNEDEIMSELTTIDDYEIKDKNFSVTATGAKDAMEDVRGIVNLLAQVKSTDASVTIRRKIINETVGSSVNGTARINGSANAYSNGKWGIPHNENALIGELKPELLVRDGRAQIIGANGPEIRSLRRGDIIFNGDQTESILRHGYVTSRGKMIGLPSHADGTMSAYFGGSRGSFGGYKTYSGYTSSSSSTASTDATKANTKAVNENTQSAEELSDKFDSYQDWIAQYIDSYDKQYAQMDRLANQLYDNFADQNKTIDQMVKLTEEFQSKYTAMYDRYMQQAYASGLSQNYQKKVISGEIDIESITGESLQKKIEEFKKWYDAAEDVKNKVQELNVTLKDLANQKLTNIEDDYDKIISYYESKSDFWSNEAEVSIKRGWQTQANNESQMQKALTATLTNIDVSWQKANQLQLQLDNLVNSGKIQKYSDAWYDWSVKIENAWQQVDEFQSSYKDLVDSLREYRWSEFNKEMDTLLYSLTEIDDLINRVNADNLIDELGAITAEGESLIGLTVLGINNQKQKLQDYAKALGKIEEELRNGLITQDEYTQIMREYLDGIRDASNAIDDYKDSLIDLYKQGLEAENSALQDNISLRKEAFNKKKEYYDYDKTLRNSQKEINALKSQAAALEGVTTAAGKAELARIQAQIAEKQQDLDDTKQDHYFDIVNSGYDDLANKANESYDEIVESIDRSTVKQEQIINEMLDRIKKSYSDTFAEIDHIISQAGINISDPTYSLINQGATGNGSQHLIDSAKGQANDNKLPSNAANNIKTDISGVSNLNKVQSITLNKTSLSLNVGESANLTATVKPANTTGIITWSTSNSKIAIVSGGHVTVKAVGTAEIKATCGGKTATCKVTGKSVASNNASIAKPSPSGSLKSISEIANEVIQGKWGSNPDRKNKLIAAGYDYDAIQREVNRIMGYAGGTKRVGKYTIANVGEANGGGKAGEELIISPEHGVLTTLAPDDAVLPHNLTRNIYEMAEMGAGDFIASLKKGITVNMPDLSGSSGYNVVEYNGDCNVNIYPQQKLTKYEIDQIAEYSVDVWTKQMRKGMKATGNKIK